MNEVREMPGPSYRAQERGSNICIYESVTDLPGNGVRKTYGSVKGAHPG